MFWLEPEDELLLFFCLDCEEPLPLSEDDLLLSFLSDLLPEEVAGRGFACDFRLALPVTSVDSLHEFPESGKSHGLVVVDHFVLDPLGEAVVSLPEECCLAPVDTGRELREFDEVFRSVMIFLHTKSFEFCFGFPYGVESGEVGFQFPLKRSKSEHHAGSMGSNNPGSKQSNAEPFK